MGVPTLERATRSATDALTLVAEDFIRPFDEEGRLREMNLHSLPWPIDVLAELGGTAVELRITLSYFVEPNPSRRGWVRRYGYASHGLRFDVRRRLETTDDFRKRVNAKAWDPDEGKPQPVATDAPQWTFGPDNRGVGGVHTDVWHGTAAELAARGVIAVYPVAGWWKEGAARQRRARTVRYALVVSIETPPNAADIWTPVALEIGVPISIAIDA